MGDRRERNHKWYSEFRERDMVFVIEDGEGNEVTIPAKYEVCETCEGRGKHVNPGIDSQGLTGEDFDRDPDFFEDYMSGMYDVPCNECHGARVAPVVDEDRCTKAELDMANSWIDSHYEMEREYEAERRMGA